MRAKKINEYGDGYLPAGAANDPRAPYNQKDVEYQLDVEDGELVLYSSYEDDGMRFDPADIDEYLAKAAGIQLEDGESIEIYDVSNEGDTWATLDTDKGNIDVDFADLENLY